MGDSQSFSSLRKEDASYQHARPSRLIGMAQRISFRSHLDAATRQRDTLRAMKPSIDHLRSLVLSRRYSVVALALVLCGWLITAAMHLHFADKETNAGGVDPRPCTYCLALSGGAAPLPDYRIPEILPQPAAAAVCYDLPAQEQITASFYLARGPPAV